MTEPRSGRRWKIVAILLGAWVLLGTPAVAGTMRLGQGVGAPLFVLGRVVRMNDGLAPSFGRQLHHALARVGRRLERALFQSRGIFKSVGITWLWLSCSVGIFLLITAFAAVLDLRMLNLLRQDARTVSVNLGRGLRIFFRIVGDPRTPYLARGVLAVSLLYWLLPFDLIPDQSVLPGCLDDLVIAIVAAKLFLRLCPDALVAWHADAVSTSR